MHPFIQLKRATPIILASALACVGLSATVQAVSPPPDVCHRNYTTAEGCDALEALTTGSGNTGLGWRSLFSNSTGSYNTGVGGGTLALNDGDFNTAVGVIALLYNTSGNENTAIGTDTLVENTTGNGNTAIGSRALYSNTIAVANTAVGLAALYSNTTGFHNVANGAYALYSNTEGDGNVANGHSALFSNTTGFQNTANGFETLFYNTTGGQNTANGFQALHSNTTGFTNTATGLNALFSNTTGFSNTATGFDALLNNTTGFNNTANGFETLFFNTTGFNNTAIGREALLNNSAGSYNLALGFHAGSGVVTASNVICIGASVLGANVSNTTWIGNIYGVTTQNGTTAPVIVSADGQLGTVASSERFKKDIASMDKASEAILSLRPVTFHYKTDTKDMPQFGLIAEEVAKVNPALVLPDKEGKPYSVRYDQVNAMLLNEFLKEHQKVEEQAATIAQLKQDFQSRLLAQQKQIETLTAGLQKVSAQLEASKPAPQVVGNP